jgi:hypothetical protein
MFSVKHRIQIVGAALALMVVAGCGDGTGLGRAGTVEVRVKTTGEDLYVDPDGYAILIDGVFRQRIGLNESLTFGPLARGEHYITIDELASGCSVDPMRRLVDVIDNSSSILFEIECRYRSGGGEWDY